MRRIDRCLSEIAGIRDVAAGRTPPYVARSRIGRLTLSIATLVAEEAALPAPDLPRPIRLPDQSPTELVVIAKRCDRLTELARHITQPSEPLADRWIRGWQELLTEIDSLESELTAFRHAARH